MNLFISVLWLFFYTDMLDGQPLSHSFAVQLINLLKYNLFDVFQCYAIDPPKCSLKNGTAKECEGWWRGEQKRKNENYIFFG